MVNKSSNPGGGTGSSGSQFPVGQGNYVVKQGDCIESIAFRHGLFWETIWNHPNNQQLRLERKTPNVILSGDKVFVPDLRPKEEPGATEKKHRFKRKGVPSKLRIVLKEANKPRASVSYILEIDGQFFSGQTNAQGILSHPIPPHAKRGKLIVISGNDKEEYQLQLGYLDPISEVSGVQARLKNLGFECGEVNGVLNSETKAAIRVFQSKYGLKETGEIDEPTRQKLMQEHGS